MSDTSNIAAQMAKKEGIQHSFEMDDGKAITLETGKLANQADGSVVVKMGNTMLLATIVSNKEAREGMDFLPLTVDYKEKYAAAGKFPGGFFKREARPSEYEILISRLVDRALRPLFPDDYHSETQVLISLISADKDTMPDSLACLAASAAIQTSDIPFETPVSEVRVARINGQLTINPYISELDNADLNILVAATPDNITMVEGEMSECSEDEMIEALQFAHEAIKKQCAAQEELVKSFGQKEIREYSHEAEGDEEFYKQVRDATYDKFYEVAKSAKVTKSGRKEKFKEVEEEFLESLDDETREEKEGLARKYLDDVQTEGVRNMIIFDKVRLDGRGPEDIRPIWTELNYLPNTHGSAIFTRGETQSLTTVTLGTKLDEQTIDGAIIGGTEDFLLHYNFPPFCTGEAKPMRGTSRREVGHGNLAHRALKQVIPGNEVNPYTVRVVSDILESNGSSSMATVCAGSLALMDAGVKVNKPVSGIAMGLITDDENNPKNYTVLSDILGDEDHLGDMDFKVTGTADGLTACQMDIKVKGLSNDILKEALEQAKKGRLAILEEMNKTISTPREDHKPHAPRIKQMRIGKEFIGAVIGPGGKIIQELQNETGAKIVVEEVGEEGVIDIVSEDKETTDEVVNRIKELTAIPEEGETYEATVKRIMPYGAFMEFLPGKEGLLHISEISWSRINDVNEVFEVGDKVKVKLLDVDDKTGKYTLSRKRLIPKPDFSNQEQQQTKE